MAAPTGSVTCVALDMGAPPPTSALLNQQLRGLDAGAVLQNAQEQITVMARVGEVGKAFEQSTTKLQSLWSLGSASAGAKGAFDQLHGCLGDMVKQGGDLAKQLQAAGKLLQSVLQILKFTKAANAAVAALLPNPFTHAAGRALAAVSKAQIVVQLGMIAQMAASIGQVMSAIQQATHQTNSTTADLGNILNGGIGATPSVGTPPTFPSQQAGAPAFPTYPIVTGTVSANTSQTGMPTVYQSSWIPTNATQGTNGTSAPAGGAGSGITVDITDADHDGRYEVKLNVPESQLKRDTHIVFDAKVGDHEVKGSFDIDV